MARRHLELDGVHDGLLLGRVLDLGVLVEHRSTTSGSVQRWAEKRLLPKSAGLNERI